MNFFIQCESCFKNVTIRDGYNNDKDIELNHVGEGIDEVRCNSCGESVVIVESERF